MEYYYFNNLRGLDKQIKRLDLTPFVDYTKMTSRNDLNDGGRIEIKRDVMGSITAMRFVPLKDCYANF